jgi:hypothetical protein
MSYQLIIAMIILAVAKAKSQASENPPSREGNVIPERKKPPAR